MKRQSFSDLTENSQVYGMELNFSKLRKSKNLDSKQRFHAVSWKGDQSTIFDMKIEKSGALKIGYQISTPLSNLLFFLDLQNLSLILYTCEFSIKSEKLCHFIFEHQYRSRKERKFQIAVLTDRLLLLWLRFVTNFSTIQIP